MCRFCEYRKRQEILDEPELREHPESRSLKEQEPAAFWIQESTEDFEDRPVLLCYTSVVDTENPSNRYLKYSRMPIKYCPVCGRKLEDFSKNTPPKVHLCRYCKNVQTCKKDISFVCKDWVDNESWKGIINYREGDE